MTECGFCQRAKDGIARFNMQVGDRFLQAEGIIQPDPQTGDHLFTGLTVDDPANREEITLHIEVPHVPGDQP